MTPGDAVAGALMVAGVVFFVAGTVGILRFPDPHSRLHAVTKADTLGLGLIVAGLALQAEGIAAAAKLLVIWLAALASSAGACYLIARDGHAASQQPSADG